MRSFSHDEILRPKGLRMTNPEPLPFVILSPQGRRTQGEGSHPNHLNTFQKKKQPSQATFL